MSAASDRQVADFATQVLTWRGYTKSDRQGQTVDTGNSQARIVAESDGGRYLCLDINDIGLSLTPWWPVAGDQARVEGVTTARREAAVRVATGRTEPTAGRTADTPRRA